MSSVPNKECGFKQRQSKVHELIEEMSAPQKQKWICLISNNRQLIDPEENVRLKYELERYFALAGSEKYDACLKKIELDVQSNQQYDIVDRPIDTINNWVEETGKMSIQDNPLINSNEQKVPNGRTFGASVGGGWRAVVDRYFKESNDDLTSVYDDF